MSEELNFKTMEEEKTNNGKRGLTLLIIGMVILVAIIVFLVLTIFASPVKKNDWYAVFLTNGRTYFGQIVKQNSQTMVLNEVYYLQMQQTPAQEEGQESQPQLSLMNIEDELHGPKDEMQINRDHVLYIQELKENSQVLSTIKQQAGE